jgi:hypothetical protein
VGGKGRRVDIEDIESIGRLNPREVELRRGRVQEKLRVKEVESKRG